MKEVALRSVTAEMLEELAKENQKIMVFTSDATGSASLNAFAQHFPEKLVEMGIAEQNEVTVAAALSSCGFTSMICAPAAFMSARALEQVKIDVAYANANVKIIGISGGLSYGTSGTTHHAITDLAAIVPMENIRVLLPSDSVQMRWLIRELAESPGPYYVRIGRNPVPAIYEDGEKFEIGKAKLVRDGSDLTIIAAGETLCHAVQAAEKLKDRGIGARVLDMFSVKPMDQEAVILAARQTGRILVAEEHTEAGGIGSLVTQLTSAHCPVPVRCLALPSGHLVTGSDKELFRYYGLDAEGIERAATAFLRDTALSRPGARP